MGDGLSYIIIYGEQSDSVPHGIAMVTPTCPKCAHAIPREDVHVANDVAYCRACNLSHSLSALTHEAEMLTGVDLQRPPAGTWNRNAEMGGVVIGATHRSLGAAVGLLAVSLFWNGIVSVFVALAVASTLNLLGVPAPDWFPAPKMNGGPMGVGITIFLWLFLTPFILIGSAMIAGFFSCLAGHTEVSIRNAEGIVFSGIGAVGRRRRFDARGVQDVRLDHKHWRDSDGADQSKTHIIIEPRQGKPIKFGSMLREDRKKFLTLALRKALIRG
jgi:hypothetical protein